MSKPTGPFNLSSTFLRLRSDVTVEPLSVDGTFWQRLAEGRFGSSHNEYLVTCHTFDSACSSWEMHPNGDVHTGTGGRAPRNRTP